MYDTILVPTDGSEEAQKAVDHAIELASHLDADIHTLYVVNIPDSPRAPYISADEDEIRQAGQEYGEEVTTKVADQASEAGVDGTGVVRTGSVHEEIVDYAEENDVDAIVMGTGYRGKVGSLLGSVAEKVVRTANVPVTTLRRTVDEV